MDNLRASYNNDTKRIMEQAKQEKASLENLNFLINLATVADNGVETKKIQKSVEPSKGRVTEKVVGGHEKEFIT